MAIYGFSSLFTFANIPRGTTSTGIAGMTQPNPHINVYAPGVSQSSHVEGGRVPNLWEEHRVESSDVEDFTGRGFYYLDSAMKHYWSDIRVPTKDSYRFVRTKVAGMHKSLQIWNEELKHGRVKLPVISISRTGHDYNVQKFTPPYSPFKKRHLNNARSMIALSYRPVPYIVNYTLNIWFEHKTDADYVMYQILTRFNSMAEVFVSDDHTCGGVQMTFKSSTDASDKEAAAEQYAKVKYEVSYSAEAWLSIPEKIMPTILGTVYATEVV